MINIIWKRVILFIAFMTVFIVYNPTKLGKLNYTKKVD